jgi:hypothetical protein
LLFFFEKKNVSTQATVPKITRKKDATAFYKTRHRPRIYPSHRIFLSGTEQICPIWTSRYDEFRPVQHLTFGFVRATEDFFIGIAQKQKYFNRYFFWTYRDEEVPMIYRFHLAQTGTSLSLG